MFISELTDAGKFALQDPISALRKYRGRFQKLWSVEMWTLLCIL
jgi:hypothetical protein